MQVLKKIAVGNKFRRGSQKEKGEMLKLKVVQLKLWLLRIDQK